ncbi:MAG: PaaI family thioesterase [Roseateles sp.]
MEFPVRIPFVEQLGLQLHALGEGEAELRLAIAEPHLNSWRVAHGGVVMTLLDVAMAHAARSVNRHLPDLGPGVVTVEMKTSFMRPGEGQLRAVGRLLHRSTTMAFCEGSVWGPGDKLCAHATGTFKYLRALPAGRRLQALGGEGD